MLDYHPASPLLSAGLKLRGTRQPGAGSVRSAAPAGHASARGQWSHPAPSSYSPRHTSRAAAAAAPATAAPTDCRCCGCGGGWVPLVSPTARLPPTHPVLCLGAGCDGNDTAPACAARRACSPPPAGKEGRPAATSAAPNAGRTCMQRRACPLPPPHHPTPHHPTSHTHKKARRPGSLPPLPPTVFSV